MILSQSRNSVKGSLVLFKWGKGKLELESPHKQGGALSMTFCEVVDDELDVPEV